MTQCIRGHTQPNPALTNTPLLTATRIKTTLHACHPSNQPPHYQHGQDQGEASHWQQQQEVIARARRVSGQLHRPCRHHRRYHFPSFSHDSQSLQHAHIAIPLSSSLPTKPNPPCRQTNPAQRTATPSTPSSPRCLPTSASPTCKSSSTATSTTSRSAAA
jgi:hypothetical protein